MTPQVPDRLSLDGSGFDSETSLQMATSTTSASSLNFGAGTTPVGAASRMEDRYTLNKPPSAKASKVREALENLVAENSRLKAELNAIHSRHADSRDRMVTDLVKTKAELQSKTIAHSQQRIIADKQNRELERLRNDLNHRPADLQDAQSARDDAKRLIELEQQVDQLKSGMREKALILREKEQTMRERQFEFRALEVKLLEEQNMRGQDARTIQELQSRVTDKDQTMQANENSLFEAERAKADNLQQEVNDLKTAHTSALSQIDTGNAKFQQLLDELNNLRATLDAAQSETERIKSQQSLQDLRQWKTEREELEAEGRTRDADIQRLTRELENIQVSSQKMVDEMVAKLQARKQLEASHSREITETLRMMTFFKKNSETSTTRVKALEMELRSLKNPSQKHLDIQDSGSPKASSTPPGAWPSPDMQRSSLSLRRKPVGLSEMSSADQSDIMMTDWSNSVDAGKGRRH